MIVTKIKTDLTFFIGVWHSSWALTYSSLLSAPAGPGFVSQPVTLGDEEKRRAPPYNSSVLGLIKDIKTK